MKGFAAKRGVKWRDEGVQPGQTFGRLLSGRGGLTGGECDQLQGGCPAFHFVTQTAVVIVLQWGGKAAVKELFRLLVIKSQLARAQL